MASANAEHRRARCAYEVAEPFELLPIVIIEIAQRPAQDDGVRIEVPDSLRDFTHVNNFRRRFLNQPFDIRHDVLQRMWGHRRVAEQHYSELNARARSIIEAYCAGVNKYIDEHPAELPAWGFKIKPWQVVAYSRYTIWSWHQNDAAADLKRAGIEPDPIPYLGSNEMLIAPFRTAAKAPIAVIDPHLSWYGETRYYEMRVYGGDLAYSGGTRLG